MSSRLEDYQHLKDLEAQPTAAQFSQEISDSLIVQYNWGDLLSAAPLALSFVGTCQLVASAPAASGIKLKRPSRGFIHLRYTSLQANLMFLADTGRSAFLEAEGRMEVLKENSRYLFSETGPWLTSKLNKIIDALSDEESAKRTLPRYLNTLTRRVKECEDSLEKMEAKFENWLEVAQELSQVATDSEPYNYHDFRKEANSSDDTSSKKVESDERILAQEARKEFAEEEKKRREEAVEEAKRRMTMAEDAFKSASKNIPSGWDAIGMNIVDGLGQSVLAIGSALVAAFSPYKYVALGHSVLGMVKSTIPQREGFAIEQEEVGDFNSGSASQAMGEDPGLGQVEILITFLSTLLILTRGKTGDCHDWDQFHSKRPNGNHRLIYVRTGLEISEGQLKRNAASGTFSADIRMITEEALKVVDELSEAMKDQREISAAPVLAAAGNWSETLSRLQDRALALKARKDRLPGLAMGVKPPNMKRSKLKSTPGGSVVQSHLASATAMYESSTKNLQVQRQILDASTEKLMDNLAKISEIQHSISRLNTENMAFGEIVRILRESIKNLSGLKAQITSLLRFFRGISAMVEFAAKGPCQDFLETLESGLERDRLGVVAGITFRDFQKQLLMTTTSTIRGYFSIVFDVSQLYVEISRKYIMPGVNLIDELGLTQASDNPESREIISRNERLVEYKDGAVTEIRKLAENKKRSLLARIDQRIQIRQTASQLAPSPQRKETEEPLENDAAAVRNAIQDQPSYIDEKEKLLIGGFDEEL
ncbi:uncharacterized protein PAC_19497 [Phialocephala subalpina]|uniref:Uncharacterized protein n=1 Tax=Phialocephala subalpina TaxID=576137 RepID=A0A1L7XX63_9HELO|nr:uncharacterized protein PAC_19497 [Phialocephala subalpina]